MLTACIRGGAAWRRSLAYMAVVAVSLTAGNLPALAQSRFEAAVIGNSAYPVAGLPNAARDAAMVAEALAVAGFNVRTYLDVPAADFAGVLDEIGQQFADAEFTILYYAGHAFQRNGRNELLAVDIEELGREEIEAKSIALSELVSRTATVGTHSERLRLIIIDACRNDPFSGLDEAIQPGILFEESGDGQTLISYATSAGQLAFDGPSGGHGPYALALARAIEGGGASVSAVLRSVRRDVRIATDGLQIPWVVGSTETDPVIGAAGYADLPEITDEVPELADLVWPFVRTDLTVASYEQFAQAFPHSPHSETAIQKMREIRALRADETRQVAGPGREISRETLQQVEKAVERAGAEGGYEPETNIPAELFAIWPAELPPAPEGLATIVTRCDLLATDPSDPQAVAPPLRDGLVNRREAAKACGFALARNSDNPRLQFQFGRVMQLLGLHDIARVYYARAAASGYSAALANLGYMAIQGIGQEVDHLAAAAYYRRAATLGNLRARTNIGTMFIRGQGVPQLPEEGVLWYRLAAGMGWTNAQNALGDLYRRGIGVREDLQAAAALYRIAAENGQRDAMNNLGRSYVNAWGVAKDPALARLWLNRAVLAGDRFAPRNLALELLKGDAAADIDEAVRLFELSAERGEVRAYLDLAAFYTDGKYGDVQPEAGYLNARFAEIREVQGADALVARLRTMLDEAAIARLEEQIRQRRRLNGL